MSEHADFLVYTLSARGAMRWQSFKAAFHTLRRKFGPSAPTDGFEYSPRLQLLRCVRLLGELGHCDFDFSNAGRVYIGPPQLFRLPLGGSVIAGLAGARTPSLLDRLRLEAERTGVLLTATNPPGDMYGTPRSFIFRGESPIALRQLAEKAGISFADQPPAWEIAHYAGGVSDFLATLRWLPATEPNWGECGYDPIQLSFTGNLDTSDALRLSRHEERGRWQFALWKGNSRATVDLDWSRYAIAHSKSLRIIAYDSRQCIFAVPAAAPLPPPIARALGLCAAKPALRQFAPALQLDIVSEQRLYDFYTDVPLAIAELVAQRLGQPFIHTNINLS